MTGITFCYQEFYNKTYYVYSYIDHSYEHLGLLLKITHYKICRSKGLVLDLICNTKYKIPYMLRARYPDVVQQTDTEMQAQSI